jgi:hypothetical protein
MVKEPSGCVQQKLELVNFGFHHSWLRNQVAMCNNNRVDEHEFFSFFPLFVCLVLFVVVYKTIGFCVSMALGVGAWRCTLVCFAKWVQFDWSQVRNTREATLYGGVKQLSVILLA